MIVHGGINDLGKVLEDVICFDTSTHEWLDIEVVPQFLNKFTVGSQLETQDISVNNDPGDLYYHKCAPVFYQQRYDFWNKYLFDDKTRFKTDDPLVKMPQIEWGSIDNYIKQEGIYFFGGKRSLGELSNELWCLKLCDKLKIEVAMKIAKTKQISSKERRRTEFLYNEKAYGYFQWEKISTEGAGPCERYAHCCHYYTPLNSLVVYGGRSDTNK